MKNNIIKNCSRTTESWEIYQYAHKISCVIRDFADLTILQNCKVISIRYKNHEANIMKKIFSQTFFDIKKFSRARFGAWKYLMLSTAHLHDIFWWYSVQNVLKWKKKQYELKMFHTTRDFHHNFYVHILFFESWWYL